MSELDLGPINKLLEDFTWEDFAPMVAHQYLIDCVAEVERLKQREAAYENGLQCLEAYLSQFPGQTLLRQMIGVWFEDVRGE